MKHTKTNLQRSVFFFLLLFATGQQLLVAQTKVSTYVDNKGTLRWTANKKEVTEFGANYALPFSNTYANAKEMGLDLEKETEKDVYHLTRLGLKAFRVHVWDSELSDTIGNLLNNDHLRMLDYTLKEMKDRGFKVVLTPIAFWEGVPEKGKTLPGFSHKYGKNNSYSNPGAIQAAENYLYQFVNHVNPYTGIAYKDDPDIVAFEISNEPTPSKETAEETTVYINRLVKAIRDTGCQKPLFYCMAFAYHLMDAYLASDIQGGSVQWYPHHLAGGFNFEGNLLTQVDYWPKDSITNRIKNANKALISYEFDAADSMYPFSYPMMAREMRKAGFQFAAMFSYDPISLAHANFDQWHTHYANLAYTPQKALGLKIAGEVFRRTPMRKAYDMFPADTIFDAFRMSYSENLAEMNTEDKFMYANNTHTEPVAIRKLKEVAGYGSSPVVKYEGKGAYFLDKLENGVWRLEVMPDAMMVDNPYTWPQQADSEVSAVVWNTWPMTIDLPDLGDNFTLTGINENNTRRETAVNKQVQVYPGTYLLVKSGAKLKWKPTDKWKDITLNEFVAPQATKSTFIIHQPVESATRGSVQHIDVQIFSQQKPEAVKLHISTPRRWRGHTVDFVPTAPYTYRATVPDELLQQPGILNYRISVTVNGERKSCPKEAVPNAINYSRVPAYTLIVNEKEDPICLLDVRNDFLQLRKTLRGNDLTLYPSSAIPGKVGLELATDNLIYTSFFFKHKVAGRQKDMAAKKHLTLWAHPASNQPVKVWIALQQKNGLEYGKQITLTPGKFSYKIPLSELQQIRVKGPGESRSVLIEPFSRKEYRQDMNITEAETFKIMYVRGENSPEPASAVLEYVTLD